MPFAFQGSEIAREALGIWKAGVSAVNAGKLVKATVKRLPDRLRIGEISLAHEDFHGILVVGAGKATAWMAEGLETALGTEYAHQKRLRGRVNVPDDQVAPTKFIESVGCRPPGINLPTDRVLESTAGMLGQLEEAHAEDLCICLISGGGSALLEKPIHPISLDELRQLTTALSGRGASIEELNLIRKQISEVKGGRLLNHASCRTIVTLIVSDVLGDPIEWIASGPTVVESRNGLTGPADAIKLLQTHFGKALDVVPASVVQVLKEAAAASNSFGKHPAAGKRISNQIIGNNEVAVAAAADLATQKGWSCETETSLADGDVTQVVDRMISRLGQAVDVDEGTPFGVCFVSGGEPTVQLSENPGQGGRNQQLVLLAMLEMMSSAIGSKDRLRNVEFCLLSGGTDGEDGNVPVAGAYVDSSILARLHEDRTNRDQIVDRLKSAARSNNSFSLLDELGCVIRTPPTRTNVCDLRVLLCRRTVGE
jgi:glycerate 2-kinase